MDALDFEEEYEEAQGELYVHGPSSDNAPTSAFGGSMDVENDDTDLQAKSVAKAVDMIAADGSHQSAANVQKTSFPGYLLKPGRKSYFDRTQMDQYVSQLQTTGLFRLFIGFIQIYFVRLLFHSQISLFIFRSQLFSQSRPNKSTPFLHLATPTTQSFQQI